jgi:hypothetical protein
MNYKKMPKEIIYTRTSSAYSFKKDSPERQEQIIRKNRNLKNKKVIVFNEQCKANVPLREREQFSKILELAKKFKIV